MSESNPQPRDQSNPIVLDDLDRLVGDSIEHGKAAVANKVTLFLVLGLLAAPILFIFAIWLTPTLVSDLKSFFENWFTVLGPIVGTAVGFYFGERRTEPTRNRPIGRGANARKHN